MTEVEANVLIRINETEYFNLGNGENVVYIAVVKKSNDDAVKNDYLIEIGLDDFTSYPIEKQTLILKDRLDKEVFKKYINGDINIVDARKVSLQSNLEQTIRLKEITGGASIFYEKSMNKSGTAGAFFKMINNNDVYLLSNYHVAVDEDCGSKTNIIHPSHQDAAANGLEDLIIGTIYWKCLNSFLDAAIIKIDYPVALGKYTIANTIIFDGITSPKIGENVKKYGRTTGVTFGEVKSINCTVNVSHNIKNPQYFRNQILTTCMSKPGDSGSVLVNNKNQVVGLLFAGDEIKATFSNNIINIFNSNIENEPKINFSKFI